MRRRTLFAAWLAAALTAGCSSPPTLEDHAAERPLLVLERYFDGELQAHGIFTDRGGKVQRRFTVDMVGRWNGADGVLDEHFLYSDGQRERRVWRLRKEGEGRYTGTADDVVGVARGRAAGNAFRWSYTLRLPVDGRPVEVQFDDWMYLVDDRVVLNKAVMSKFGIRLGEVTLAFAKRPCAGPACR